MRKKSKYKPKGVRLDNIAWVMSSVNKAADSSSNQRIVLTQLPIAQRRMKDGARISDVVAPLGGIMNGPRILSGMDPPGPGCLTWTH